MVTQQEHELATLRFEQTWGTVPHAVGAAYIPESDTVVIDLSSGSTFSFPRKRAQGIDTASAEDLAEVEISASGYAIRFPRIDADLWLPSMLEGRFGTDRWEAAWAEAHPVHQAA
jgi:hypothetical protein